MPQLVRFGCFEVDLAAGHIRKRGNRIHLRDQPFQVLAALLEQPGEVVTRDDLRRRLWGDEVFVDYDNGLNIAIARLRTVLGDSAEHPRFIETLPKKGYRFIGDVSPVRSATDAAPAPRPRLAVLPFLNSSGDPAQEYFSDAMTDEIITALASLVPERLAVIARTTAMRYKGTQKNVVRIGRELNVDYVVEGTLRRTGNQMVVNVQLIHAGAQTHLFAKRYHSELRDIFRLHDSIALDIATHVNASGIAEDVRALFTHAPERRQPTGNLSAYNEYIQGRHILERMTPEATARAKQHFEDAIRLDPEFALAYDALADLYSWLGYTGYMRPKDAYSIGIPYALRAVEINDSLAEAHAVLAEYHKQLNYDWPAAEREMARALELNPESPLVRLRHAVGILMPKNRIQEAVSEIECALELDPLAGFTRAWLGVMLLLAEEYDRAIEECRCLLELEPTSCWAHFIIGIAYRQKYFEESSGRRRRSAEESMALDFADLAVAGHLKAVELSPGSDYFLGWLGLALGVCGRKGEARALLEQLRRSDRYILPTSIAHIHLGLGDFDAALEWFDRAVEERDQNMMPILSYRHFDPLRQDPRFAVLLRKMRLGIDGNRTES
jgi:TolB-like protein